MYNPGGEGGGKLYTSLIRGILIENNRSSDSPHITDQNKPRLTSMQRIQATGAIKFQGAKLKNSNYKTQ